MWGTENEARVCREIRGRLQGTKMSRSSDMVMGDAQGTGGHRRWRTEAMDMCLDAALMLWVRLQALGSDGLDLSPGSASPCGLVRLVFSSAKWR